ncbi:DUF4233 domain-containing protein [Microbacterium karelineae]|uniref:DUF4233 domain-containing protein n=1 Tax=Microbacterium karelineae TaxID=2654283 RepID=UPI0012E9C130|nr:DUF4233 domain-containing protein [Microbacterium karelineae]
MTAAAPRARRYRTLPEKIGSVVLGFEAIVVFLAGLVIFGLRALPSSVPPWWGIVAGAVMLVVLLALSGALRWRWARVTGWILQGVIALGALLVPSILLVTIIFGAMWAYAMIGGARIERRVQAQRSAAGGDLPDTP